MIKNYFFLNRHLIEIRDYIRDKKILSVFTQEKEKLIIEFENSEQNIFLEICVNHSLPYFLVRDFYIRKKKNSLDLFSELIDKKIIECLIAENDRVIAFLLEDNLTGLFTVRGKLTNFYLIDDKHQFKSFKKVDENDLKIFQEDISNINFINRYNIPAFEQKDYNLDIPSLKKNYPFIGKEILLLAENSSSGSFLQDILNVIIAIEKNKPVVIIDNDTFEIEIKFEELSNYGNNKELHKFDSVNEALKFFLKQKEILADKKNNIEIILKHLEKELKRITTKQNNLLNIIQKGNKEKEYKRFAELLLINLSKINSGMSSVIVEDSFSEGNKVEISLDPKLSPQENVQKYFDKAKESKIAFQKAKELIERISEEKQKLINYKERLLRATSLKEIDQIAKGLRIKMKMKNENSYSESLTDKFKQYIIDNKYKVYVGKDSKSNDLLTLKFAKQNDYWFHARSVPGSHVILRVENVKEPVPKSVLKKVAALAAFHSKAKTAGVVPVSYTLKKFVVKRKGMEPGKVALLKEDTLLVEPGIVEGVEFLET